MDDKQIIIDGVDVSVCKLYNEDNGVVAPDGTAERTELCYLTNDYCENNPNCYYKQLKRKEQECNKLYIQLKSDEEYHKEEENTLRKIIKNKEKRNIELYKENNKLQQTLTGIKEIAEQISLPMGTGKSSNRVILANQILQKIKEVLNGTNS